MSRTVSVLLVLVAPLLVLLGACGCSHRTAVSADPSVPATTPVAAASAGAAPGAGEAGKAASESPASLQGAELALSQAESAGKHLIVLAYRWDDERTQKMKAVLKKAGQSLAAKAVCHLLDVADEKEAGFVERYGLSQAPLPLTLVLAPNGAVVRGFAQRVVDVTALAASLASPKLAEVLKLLQERKLVLLCVQGSRTKHNAESLAAAKAVVADPKASGSIQWVQVDPGDAANTDLLNPLKLDATLQEATIGIVVPPRTLAGTVPGATTRDALWEAITTGVSSCGSGCAPGGCG